MTKKENKDVDIDLPESISAEKRLPTDNQVVIGIDKKGSFFYNGIPASIMEVHQRLRKLTLSDPEMQIRLDADTNAPLYSVVNIVDMCQFNNLDNIVLRTYDEYYNR
jgi:biopolymer transport protein ExbD